MTSGVRAGGRARFRGNVPRSAAGLAGCPRKADVSTSFAMTVAEDSA